MTVDLPSTTWEAVAEVSGLSALLAIPSTLEMVAMVLVLQFATLFRYSLGEAAEVARNHHQMFREQAALEAVETGQNTKHMMPRQDS